MRYVRGLFISVLKQWGMLGLAHPLWGLRASRLGGLGSGRVGIGGSGFSGHCLYMGANMYLDFKICISVPFFVLCGHFAPPPGGCRGVVRVGWRTVGRVWVSVFRGFSACIGRAFRLPGGLGAGLAFCGVWALS